VKKLLALLILIPVSAMAQRATRYEIFASEHGTNTSVTLNKIISDRGSQETVLVLDWKTWAITNDVTFPSNFTVRVMEGAKFNVYTNYTLTFRDCDFEAGHYDCFDGAGSVTGSARFLWLQDQWGAVPGTGDISQVSTWQEWMTNAYPLLDTDYTDDVTMSQVSNVVNGATSGVAFASLARLCDVSGCWADYVDDDTVQITNGCGVCVDEYFEITSVTNIDLTSPAAASTNIAYIYLSYDASTFPDALTFYDSTTEPEYQTNYHGWYCSTQTTDRCIDAIRQTNGVIALFTQVGDGKQLAQNVEMAASVNPSGGWDTPAVNSDTLTPVNIKRMRFYGVAEDSGADCDFGVTTWEMEADFGIAPVNGHARFYQASGAFSVSDWIELGPSRKVKINGENDDDNSLGMYMTGWEIRR